TEGQEPRRHLFPHELSEGLRRRTLDVKEFFVQLFASHSEIVDQQGRSFYAGQQPWHYQIGKNPGKPREYSQVKGNHERGGENASGTRAAVQHKQNPRQRSKI